MNKQAKQDAIHDISQADNIDVEALERMLDINPDMQLTPAEINALLDADEDYQAWLKSVEMSNEELDAYFESVYNKETDDMSYLMSLEGNYND